VTWRSTYQAAAARLESPMDARRIVEEAASGDWPWLLDEAVSERAQRYCDDMVARRLAGEPLQYVLGRWGFRHLDLIVDRRVLIPRPETEHLVEEALELPPGSRVVDVGTGSGAVALALKQEQPDLEVVGTDASPSALEVARANAAALDLDVTFVEGDLLAGQTADAVLSNPPYVETHAELGPEIGFEPREALFAGLDGLDVHKRLVPAALASGARFVALEIGAGQALAVGALFPSAVEIVKDLAGHDRVVVWRC
jgi:release factor glutamine methyltransferase